MTTEPPSYQVRRSLFHKERTYRLEQDALSWSETGRNGRLQYSDIERIRLFATHMAIDPSSGGVIAPDSKSVVVSGPDGQHVLSSNHFVGLGDFEDRSATFIPFVAALIERVAAASPATIFIRGLPAGLLAVYMVLAAIIAIVIVIFVALLIREIPKGMEEVGTIVFAASFLVGLAGAEIALIRLLIRDWPRPFDPR
jgi:hypothetical protein